MDMRRDTEPDMSTYLGVDMSSVLGPLFWGKFFSCWVHGALLNISVGTLVSMMWVSVPFDPQAVGKG